MSRTGELLLALVAFCGSARAEPPTSLEQLSPVDRTQADFYGAIAGPGPGVTAAWSLDSDRVALGGDIALTLTVTNAANPGELLRPNLAERPEWKELFGAIRDEPAKSPGEFRYRLKPRNAGRFELPVPKYRFYQPRLPDGRRFQTAFVENPTLVVDEAVAVSGPSIRIPLEAPARFFDEPPDPPASRASPPAGLWCGLFACGAIVPTAWIALWRRNNPDGAKLARIRRAKSVRAALDALGRAERSPELVSKILLRYLQDRWHLPASAQAPSEVATALRIAEVPRARIGELEQLLNRCDGVRFGNIADNGVSLAGAAVDLIRGWEGANG